MLNSRSDCGCEKVQCIVAHPAVTASETGKEAAMAALLGDYGGDFGLPEQPDEVDCGKVDKWVV